MFTEHFQGVQHCQTVTVITGTVVGENAADALAFFAPFQIVTAAEKITGGAADITDDSFEIRLFADSFSFTDDGFGTAAHYRTPLMGDQSAESTAAREALAISKSKRERL